MNKNRIEYLLGTEEISSVPEVPFAEKTLDFLAVLSEELRNDKEARAYSDIMTFAFWIRRNNLQKLKEKYIPQGFCQGRGLIFHIAPSNVPINFAYTWVFGLLAGNSNIVKVSSKNFVQVKIISRIVANMLNEENFAWVQKENALVMYSRENTEITDAFSALCDVRVIWGGDYAISQIRKSPLSPRSTEMVFADRYSFAILASDAIMNASDTEMHRLGIDFYNDTYLMDQNACSSPHFVCWTGEQSQVEAAKERFWQEVRESAEKYDLADMKVSEKYTLLCEYAATQNTLQVKRYGNLLYVAEMGEMPHNITTLRGKYGLFFEKYFDSLEEILLTVNDKKVQTCAVYGIQKENMVHEMLKNHICGIDRIVPIGKTLDIGLLWDGYRVITELSRQIDII